MTTSLSTRPSASGNRQAINRSVRLPPIHPSSGRQTRTAKKALKPITPPKKSPPTTQKQLVNSDNNVLSETIPLPQNALNSPTLPSRFSPFSIPNFVLPNISRLKDFPNSSVPSIPTQPIIKVTLPESAPTSPCVSYQSEGLDKCLQSGDPVTPSGSPEVSVILPNPGYIIIPEVKPKSSTPSGTPSNSPYVGSWDNFVEEPSYQGLDQEFWDSRGYRQIEIVSTDNSEVEDLSPLHFNQAIEELSGRGQFCSNFSGTDNLMDLAKINSPTMAEKKASAICKLKHLETKVRDMCDDLDPEFISKDSAPSMAAELDKIGSVRDEYRNAIRSFMSDYNAELSGPELEQWKHDMEAVLNRVKKHKFDVLACVNKFTPQAAPMSEFEKETIALQKQQLELQQNTESSKQKEAEAIAQPLKKLLIEKCNNLDEDLEQISVTMLKTGDEQQVVKVMHKLSDWKGQLESISVLHQQLLTKTALHPLPSEDQTQIDAAFERTKASLADIVTTAEEEDDRRQLYSLDTTNRGDQVKWPVFGGEVGEDFFKFKADFTDAAKQNRTSIKNQTSKLRENLRGYAKSLLPGSVSDIDKALSILEKACGDTMRVVNHRVDNLLKVGAWPQEGHKDCYSKQVKWIVRVQALLQEIIDLANTDESLADVIYNREKLAQILRLFPTFMVDKLAKIDGYKEEKYKSIIQKLDEWKLVSQNRELIYGSAATSTQCQTKPNRSEQSTQVPSGHINFPQPKRLQSCRICQVLKAQGETVGLFENHFSDYATGCPKFAKMGTDQRMVTAREARFCINCMSKEVKFGRQHSRDCPIKKKKSLYSCKKDSCLIHMWLCSKHQQDNKEQMEIFSQQLMKKSGIRLVYVAKHVVGSLSKPGNSATLSPTQLYMQPSQNIRTAPKSPTSPTAFCSMGEKGIKQAVRKMTRFNKKKDPDVETVSPPLGAPLFLFQPIEGLHDPVNCFYDKGCSDAVFREGIPGIQLRGTLLSKGPFQMGGVGNIATVAEEEWLVQFNRTDNKKQLVRGVTLKQITCDFPPIDTSAAVKEIKDTFKDDEFLQNCKVPMIAGGKVDILLGIQYSIIQPIPIRELDCGLTIYRSRLVSHNKADNALIGGPHTSFQFLANKAGNVSALLTHFAEGLKNIQSLRPPRISSNPLTFEEEQFALVNNLKELNSNFKETGLPMCTSCLISTIDESPDTIKEIKKLRLEQECGIDDNYRCSKCRDCSACKDSDRTEEISLRDEAELELIDQSVSIDLVNKQIVCSLPTKGEERDFLTNNYSQARKILEQQVNQYRDQPVTKELIMKAFTKLFDNHHAVFIDELPSDLLNEFAHKEIQYWIPWRIAFSNSVTTPARPVLDASSRTRKRADGSGGKSLNDLVIQGKVDTLNILNLFLNFRVGKFALSGDLTQFYNSCKLLPQQWNLQRFLFQDNLDPSAPVRHGIIKTLIYGVASVSAQSENAMKKLGAIIEQEKPVVKKLIEKKRYVDDIADSKATKEECISEANI